MFGNYNNINFFYEVNKMRESIHDEFYFRINPSSLTSEDLSKLFLSITYYQKPLNMKFYHLIINLGKKQSKYEKQWLFLTLTQYNFNYEINKQNSQYNSFIISSKKQLNKKSFFPTHRSHPSLIQYLFYDNYKLKLQQMLTNQKNLRSTTLFILVLGFVICGIECAPIDELVTFNIHVNYTHKWYSGYLNITQGKFHYVFFDSQNDPDNDPLILWLNGGPGCSSLIGMVTENGPFLFQPNTTMLKLNPSSWNMKANLLYIQSPGGVGFSKGSRRTYDDGTTAQDNLQALLSFFQKFPNLKKNNFYMTGQSYAGIYVPYLANEIIKFNKLPSSKQKIIKLKGIMVGNACTHPKQCYEATADGNSKYFYEFLYKRTYYTDFEYLQFNGACGFGFGSKQCKEIRARLDKKFQDTNTSILNIYAPCYYVRPFDQQKNITRRSQRIHRSKFGSELTASDMDCQDSVGIHYFFNIPGIHEHLHVDPVAWQQCSDYVSKNYVSFANASIWIYPILIKEGLRVWVYSGDVDADVPITGTLNWIQLFRQQNGLPIMQPWRQWWVKGMHIHEDQVGGMVWQLKNLTFVSIKGAGHLVPKDKPKQAYTLITSFLNGQKLPYKDQSL